MGSIQVTVQTTDRLKAINNLSAAIRSVAEALIQPIRVELNNNHINNAKIGIAIDTTEEVTETIIKETEGD